MSSKEIFDMSSGNTPAAAKAAKIEGLLKELRELKAEDIAGLVLAVKHKELKESFCAFAGDVEDILQAAEVMNLSLCEQLEKVERLQKCN